MSDLPLGPDLGHPDSTIRLVSAVHRFRVPEMGAGKKISFTRAFKSAGSHSKTKALMAKADASRASLGEALIASHRTTTSDHSAVVRAASEYLPLMNKILLSCKIQPETARLDEKLIFEWASGMELKKKFCKSEALMYELVMVIVCNAMGTAGVACDASIAGDFAGSSRGFKAASGMMQFLAEDHLPKWIARGTSIEDKELPAEASVGVCDAFHSYFLGVGQQMAIATVLIKPGTPNYSLLSKLCLGITELLEKFVNTIRTRAAVQMSRMDKEFFTLITFQINLQRALSQYFMARSVWEKKEEYGLAIAMLKEAMQGMKTRDIPTGKGLPPIEKKSPLKVLENDVKDFKKHMNTLLGSWEHDNSKVYFDRMYDFVPEERKLHKGVVMMKSEPFVMEEVDPVPLGPPGKPGEEDNSQFHDDAALARRLQDLETAESKK